MLGCVGNVKTVRSLNNFKVAQWSHGFPALSLII